MSLSNLAESKKYYTVEEYLAFEREAFEKHEYIDGQIFPLHESRETVAMAGASRRHNLVSGNIFGEIRNQLKGKNCEVYINDMRVRLNPARYVYPDVVVACSEPEFLDDEFDTLTNPVVVIKVLSPKTEKLEDFRKLESLRECLLIEQEKIFIEHYIKQTPNQWLLRIYENADETVILESIGCEVSLSDIYLQVKFKEEN